MIISQTPFRVSLFGGGSDFPDWFVSEAAAVVSGSIDKFAYLSLRRLPPFFAHKTRAVYSVIEAVRDTNELAHPAIREILGHYLPGEGVEVVYQGDLPAQSGVGSSSSFTVGLLAAVKALDGHHPTREELAREAIWVEQDLLREKVGLQDQIAAAYGGLNLITFGPGPKEFAVQSIRNSDLLAENLSRCLILVFSGTQRFSSEVQQDIAERSERSDKALSRTVQLVHEFLAISSEVSDLESYSLDLGELLKESWDLKKEMNDRAVTEDLETLKLNLLRQGATGAKILGAGGGGFLLAAVSPNKKEALLKWASRQKGSYAFGFRFVDQGARVIHNSDFS